ncbi:MAG: universal stress protein [Chloroflexi bacterium]|nr:universal stress protein [Chloroflexota bacterium]
MELLITTNGYKGTWPAIEYGAWLGKTLGLKVTLLGVTEKLNPAQIDDHHPLEDVFGRAVELFEQNGLEYRLEVQNGNAEEVIPREARLGEFITVIGPLGRPQIRHWLTGRSIHSLMEQIIGPIMYVPEMRLPLRKALICVGGLGYEVTAENLAVRLSGLAQAHITLLHVIPPMELDYPTAREVIKSAEHLADSDTPIGRALRKGVDMVKDSGREATVRIREGHIVEEILAEVKAGDYDLVCMGSPYSTSALRQIYAPNVAAEVATVNRNPTLIARHKRED